MATAPKPGGHPPPAASVRITQEELDTWIAASLAMIDSCQRFLGDGVADPSFNKVAGQVMMVANTLLTAMQQTQMAAANFPPPPGK